MAFSPPQWGNVPNAPEAQVGLRVELQVDFGDEPWVKGIVEGFSPSRQRHFIVFDDPSPDYSIDDQPRHGLSVGLTVCFFLTFFSQQSFPLLASAQSNRKHSH